MKHSAEEIRQGKRARKEKMKKTPSQDYILMICRLYDDVYDDREEDIYGHSLDVTDKDVLSSLILMPDTVTNVYVYNDEDLSKKIRNLVKIIGEDELINRTRGSKRTIAFVQTQTPETIEQKGN